MDARMHFVQKFRDFIRDPSLLKIKPLQKALNKDAIESMRSLGEADYILASLLTTITSIDTKQKNEIVTHLIGMTADFIEHTHIKLVKTLETVLAIMLQHIAVAPDYLTVQSDLSEERKLNVIRCIEVTFRRATGDVIEAFCTKENVNNIARCLMIATTSVKTESYKLLRLSAIKCILSIFWVHDEADHTDIVLRARIADALFLIIPKVLSTLCDVAIGDETQGETIIQMSVRGMSRILHLIFAEYDKEQMVSSNQQIQILIEASLKIQKKEEQNFDILKLPKHDSVADAGYSEAKNKLRSAEWLSAASIKINPLIKRLHKLAGSDSRDIRRELYILTETLLCHCQKHMSSCLATLIEINVSLHDEIDRNTQFVYNDELIGMAEEMFEALLIRLPRIIYTGYADEQAANLQLLNGIVQLLCDTDRMKITLTNDMILESFVSALMALVESDRSDKLLDINNIIYNIEDKTHTADMDTLPWKDFKNLRNPKMTSVIRSICHKLSKRSPVNVLVLENLFNILKSNSIDCNEALIIIQYFLQSAFDGNDPANESMHIVILAEALEPFRWHLAIESEDHIKISNDNKREWYESSVEGLYESSVIVSVTDSKPTESLEDPNRITIKDVKNSIQHICLVIELVSLYAKRMRQRFNQYLLKSLHRLLEKSASMYYVIRMSAVIALDNLRCAYELGSISALIDKNADYVSYAINMALKKPDQIDVALRILGVVLHYSSVNAIPHLENIIATIIKESANINQSPNILAFIRAFVHVLTTIRNHLQCERCVEKLQPLKNSSDNSRNYLEAWLNILSSGDIATDDDSDADRQAESNLEANDVTEPVEANDAEDDEVNKKVPPLIELAKKMMQQIIPYFAAKKQEIKIAAIECLSIGLDIIKDYENELLPIVHVIWTPFVGQCIRDKNPVVLRHCIRLYVKLATYAKDFILKQSSSDILPHITSYLLMLSKKSASDKQAFLYEHTQEFKLLHEFMLSLPDILIHINVQERDFDNILKAVIWLLDKNQPHQLQLDCIKFIKILSTFDICAVYVKLTHYQKERLWCT